MLTIRMAAGLAAAALAATLSTSPASAALVGQAWTGSGASDAAVGNILVDKTSTLGGDAIKYFIPLDPARPNGVFGDGCSMGSAGNCSGGYGQTQDSGVGGPVLTMFLHFSPVVADTPYLLDIMFEDLDVKPFDDKLVESIRIVARRVDGSNDTIVAWTNDVTGDPHWSGDKDTQKFSYLLSGSLSDPFYAVLKFKADNPAGGNNTAEYLRATLTPSPVPLPAAGLLLLGGLGGLGLASRRRKAA